MGEYKYRKMREQLQRRVQEVNTLTTKVDINLRDLIADKIGYSQEFFYLGETEDGKNIYHGHKTTSLVSERMISICGEPRDIERTQRYLEKKLQTELISFIQSKQYQKT